MIYAYVHILIQNPDSLAAYREKAGDALTKHGGAAVAAAPNPTSIEGPLQAPDLGVILSFPNRSAAMAWIEDPALAPVHALRRGVGQSSIILLG